jgi:hypothetical protein
MNTRALLAAAVLGAAAPAAHATVLLDTFDDQISAAEHVTRGAADLVSEPFHADWTHEISDISLVVDSTGRTSPRGNVRFAIFDAARSDAAPGRLDRILGHARFGAATVGTTQTVVFSDLDFRLRPQGGGDTTYFLVVQDMLVNPGYGIFDDLSAKIGNIVPEPAGWLSFGVGLLMLAWVRCRRACCRYHAGVA